MATIRLTAIPLIVAAAAFAASARAWAQEGQGPYYGPHMWDGGWMVFGPLTMVVLLVAIVVAAVALVRWMVGIGHPVPGPVGKTPMDILKERFARGEIDAKEFEDRRRYLE